MNQKNNPNVIAAIPTWNMGDQVISLVPQLREQGFGGIVVLDDASEDDTPHRINRLFGDEIEVIAGQENLGAAGNRNRLISHMGRLGINLDSIITFVDADTKLMPSDEPIAQTARMLVRRHPKAGIIGGQVFNADGTWAAFNFGPSFSWSYVRGSLTQLRVEQLAKTSADRAKQLQKRHSNVLKGFPDIFNPAHPKVTGWVVETFGIVRAQTYESMGGYDPLLRYCEAVDFGDRIRDKGLQCVFDPEIKIQHLQVDVRGKNRQKEINKAIARMAWRYLMRHTQNQQLQP